MNILYQIPLKSPNSRTFKIYCYLQKHDNLTYLAPFYSVFLQNSLIQNVVLLALQPLSEHKCSDNGPYFNSMTKCSAIGGDHATQEKEAFGSGEGQNPTQTLQPQNGTLLYRVDQTLHCLPQQTSSFDDG